MTISITHPTTSEPVRAILAAWGEEDDPDVIRVDVAVDRGGYQAANYTPVEGAAPGTWIVEIDTTLLEDGRHVLSARSATSAGASSSLQQIFYVQNGPVVEPFVPAFTTDQFYYGRLPFIEAQKTFALSGIYPRSGRRLSVAWHGTAVDRERGSFAVIQTGGVLSDWIGSRVRITYRIGGIARVVYGFIHNEANIVDDISIPRRSFMALAEPTLDRITALVERAR